MTDSTYNVLFLCTGNSARSILAEAILNDLGNGRFQAYSAGSDPKGEVHPGAINLLSKLGHKLDFARSKSWDEFSGPDAPKMDLIFTVCDNAASETCPIWPDHPTSAHWGIPDPAAETGDEEAVAKAFHLAHERLTKRIKAFLALPTEHIVTDAYKEELRKIGDFSI